MGHWSSKHAVSINREGAHKKKDGKCKSKAIGIDLGTTYSCVGVWQHESVEIIANDQGNRTTPSMAAFTSKFQVVGEAARFQIANNPNNTVFNAKRLIGRRFSDPCVQADIGLWPFTVVSGENDKPMIQVSYEGETRLFAPEEISAMVLSKMKKIAEDYLNCDVKDAVITVPAYFSDSQKRATKDAGTIAGLNVMNMINEPTAAAICYGFHASAGVKKNVFVFDLGGGTFDASIVRVEKGKIKMKAVGGDMHLGGEDIDNRMLDYCVKEFKRKYTTETDFSTNAKALRRLRAECERAKRSLSSTTETVIDIDGLHDGQDFHTQISRAKFEELNADLFKKCMQIVEKCLEDAKMSNGQIDDVVLVGGSSRIPKLEELLGKVFGHGKKICKSVNPDEAVAYGAAVQAAVLNKEKVQLEVVEVAPLSLGISLNNGVMWVVVPRNTRIPTRIEKPLTTVYDNQWSVTFSIYEGERSLVVDNNFLGKFVLDGIPPMRAGVPKLVVYFDVGADGILTVSAMDKETGKSNQISICNERRSLSKEEIDRMVAEAQKFRNEDAAAKKKQVARSKLECYASNMKSRAMEAKNNEMGIIKSMEDTKKWLEKNDSVGVEKLQAKLKQLELECKSLN